MGMARTGMWHFPIQECLALLINKNTLPDQMFLSAKQNFLEKVVRAINVIDMELEYCTRDAFQLFLTCGWFYEQMTHGPIPLDQKIDYTRFVDMYKNFYSHSRLDQFTWDAKSQSNAQKHVDNAWSIVLNTFMVRIVGWIYRHLHLGDLEDTFTHIVLQEITLAYQAFIDHTVPSIAPHVDLEFFNGMIRPLCYYMMRSELNQEGYRITRMMEKALIQAKPNV